MGIFDKSKELLEAARQGDAEQATRVAAAVAGGDWEFAAAAGAAAARPLLEVLREVQGELELDQETEATDAERGRQALERVVSASAADIDTDVLRELADLEAEISYPCPTFYDGTDTIFEPVTLGDTQQIQKLAAAELIRRGVTPSP